MVVCEHGVTATPLTSSDGLSKLTLRHVGALPVLCDTLTLDVTASLYLTLNNNTSPSLRHKAVPEYLSLRSTSTDNIIFAIDGDEGEQETLGLEDTHRKSKADQTVRFQDKWICPQHGPMSNLGICKARVQIGRDERWRKEREEREETRRRWKERRTRRTQHVQVIAPPPNFRESRSRYVIHSNCFVFQGFCASVEVASY